MSFMDSLKSQRGNVVKCYTISETARLPPSAYTRRSNIYGACSVHPFSYTTYDCFCGSGVFVRLLKQEYPPMSVCKQSLRTKPRICICENVCRFADISLSKFRLQLEVLRCFYWFVHFSLISAFLQHHYQIKAQCQ